jgi:hypothetical protein
MRRDFAVVFVVGLAFVLGCLTVLAVQRLARPAVLDLEAERLALAETAAKIMDTDHGGTRHGVKVTVMVTDLWDTGPGPVVVDAVPGQIRAEVDAGPADPANVRP